VIDALRHVDALRGHTCVDEKFAEKIFSGTLTFLLRGHDSPFWIATVQFPSVIS
jgi:hypothetical protein